MKTNKAKKGEIYVSPYGEYLYVMIHGDAETVIEEIRNEMPDGYNNSWEYTIRRSFDSEQGACFISVDENLHWICLQEKNAKKKTTVNLSTILHECLHITNRILEKRGLLLTRETEEAFCYLQQWLFNEVVYIIDTTVLKNK